MQKNLMSKSLKICIFTFICVQSQMAEAIVTCMMGSKPINTSNGSETGNLNGVVTCRDDDKKLRSESTYVKGKQIGRQILISFQDERIETVLNAKGNKEGLSLTYHKSGKLRESTTYKNGSKEGLQLRYTEDGKLSSKAWYKNDYETSRIDYNSARKLYELSCGDTPDFPEQAKLCGFQGVSVVNLYNGKSELKESLKYLNGKVLDSKIKGADGVTYRDVLLKDGSKSVEVIGKNSKTIAKFKVVPGVDANNLVLDGLSQIYDESGRLLTEATYEKGLQVEEKEYWQNGKMRNYVKLLDRTKTPKAYNESFNDKGVRVYEGNYSSSLYSSQLYGYGADNVLLYDVLDSKNYTDEGALYSESVYKDGSLFTQKLYNDGKITAHEYYPDGSTKY